MTILLHQHIFIPLPPTSEQSPQSTHIIAQCWHNDTIYIHKTVLYLVTPSPPWVCEHYLAVLLMAIASSVVSERKRVREGVVHNCEWGKGHWNYQNLSTQPLTLHTRIWSVPWKACYLFTQQIYKLILNAVPPKHFDTFCVQCTKLQWAHSYTVGLGSCFVFVRELMLDSACERRVRNTTCNNMR